MKASLPFGRVNVALLFLGITLSASLVQANPSLLVKFKESTQPENYSLRKHLASQISNQEIHFLSDQQTAVIHLDSSDSLEESMQTLRQNSEIEYVEEDAVISAHAIPNDPNFSRQWPLGDNLANIGAQASWDFITDTSAISIAIIDSGCNYNHEDINPNVWRNPKEIPSNGNDDDHDGYVDDYYGYDFQNNDPDPLDDFDHGTLVFGIIGAVGNNKTGITGINWNWL